MLAAILVLVLWTFSIKHSILLIVTQPLLLCLLVENVIRASVIPQINIARPVIDHHHGAHAQAQVVINVVLHIIL